MFIGRSDLDVITTTRVNVNYKHRNKGMGTKLMSRLCELADEKGYTLELGVSPDMSDNGLDYNELVDWYSEFGFREIDNLPSIMVRHLNRR